MGEKKVVNLSSFLLFEEAGDSEADFNGMTVLDYDQDHAFEAIDDDDAESCSSDVGCYGKSIEAQIGTSKQVFTETHFDDDTNDGGGGGGGVMRNNVNAIGSYHHKLRGSEEKDEDEDGMISEVTSTADSHNLRKCVHSSNQNMSEMEKSRLFWETCLAS